MSKCIIITPPQHDPCADALTLTRLLAECIIITPPQHDPCADALTLTRLLAEDQQKHVAFVREQQNKEILKAMLKKQTTKTLKEIMARMSQKDYGIIRG